MGTDNRKSREDRPRQVFSWQADERAELQAVLAQKPTEGWPGLNPATPEWEAYRDRLNAFWRERGERYGFDWRTVADVRWLSHDGWVLDEPDLSSIGVHVEFTACLQPAGLPENIDPAFRDWLAEWDPTFSWPGDRSGRATIVRGPELLAAFEAGRQYGSDLMAVERDSALEEWRKVIIANGELAMVISDDLDVMQAVWDVRPVNWRDDDDPAQRAAWERLDAALAGHRRRKSEDPIVGLALSLVQDLGELMGETVGVVGEQWHEARTWQALEGDRLGSFVRLRDALDARFPVKPPTSGRIGDFCWAIGSHHDERSVDNFRFSAAEYDATLRGEYDVSVTPTREAASMPHQAFDTQDPRFDPARPVTVNGFAYVPEAEFLAARKTAIDAKPSVALVNHLATCSNAELLDFCKAQQGVRDIAKATLGDEGFPDPLRKRIADIVSDWGRRGGDDDALLPAYEQSEVIQQLILLAGDHL